MDLPKLYTLAEVAQATGLSERALADGARTAKFEHIRQSGHRYMTADQVNRLIDQCTVSAAPPPTDDRMAKLRIRVARDTRRRQARAAG